MPRQWTARGEPEESVLAKLQDLEPLQLQVVTSDGDEALWNELVDRYHYFMYRQPMGYHLRCFLLDAQGRHLGCFMFQQAVTKSVCRAEWIGWSMERYQSRLKLVVQNAIELSGPMPSSCLSGIADIGR